MLPASRYRPNEPLPTISIARLPIGATVRTVEWPATEASPPGAPFPMPSLPAGHQLVVTTLHCPTKAQCDYLMGLGFRTWGSGGREWLSDVFAR